jgi:hypothetical protein
MKLQCQIGLNCRPLLPTGKRGALRGAVFVGNRTKCTKSVTGMAAPPSQIILLGVVDADIKTNACIDYERVVLAG